MTPQEIKEQLFNEADKFDAPKGDFAKGFRYGVERFLGLIAAETAPATVSTQTQPSAPEGVFAPGGPESGVARYK